MLLLDGENVKSHSTSFDFLCESSILLGFTQASKLGFEDAIFPELAVSAGLWLLGVPLFQRLMIVRLFITQLVWVLSGMLSFTE